MNGGTRVQWGRGDFHRLSVWLRPVIHARRTSLAAGSRIGGRGGARSIPQVLRRSLTVAQIALAVLLVIAAGLLVRSLAALSTVDTAFNMKMSSPRASPQRPVCHEPARVSRSTASWRSRHEGFRVCVLSLWRGRPRSAER